MVYLIAVKYRDKSYPPPIVPYIQEIPGHFDAKVIIPQMRYSLHTEYAYSKRNFSSPYCKGLKYIKTFVKRGVPMLWFNKTWVEDFLKFIKKCINKIGKNPSIIEIHPPFDDYCITLDQFIDVYKIFEKEILRISPKTKIFIENRYGTNYKNGKFILSCTDEIKNMVNKIKETKIKLRIVLDIPQLFSAHGLTHKNFSKRNIEEIFKELIPIREYIDGIHLWGKKLSQKSRPISHAGNLDTYLGKFKTHFLNTLYDFLNDGKPRYFVPEVNSAEEDLFSIVNDLIQRGVKFIHGGSNKY